MEKIIAIRITKWCTKYRQQSPECEIAIQYGLELLLNNILKALIILLTASFFGKFVQAALVLLTFGSLRYFAGGRHMRTGAGCFLYMCVLSAFSLFTANYAVFWSNFLFTLFFMAELIVLYYFAPMESKVNPITDQRVKQRKRLGAFAVYLILAAAIIFVPVEFKWLIFIPATVEIVSIITVHGRRKCHEQ